MFQIHPLLSILTVTSLMPFPIISLLGYSKTLALFPVLYTHSLQYSRVIFQKCRSALAIPWFPMAIMIKLNITAFLQKLSDMSPACVFGLFSYHFPPFVLHLATFNFSSSNTCYSLLVLSLWTASVPSAGNPILTALTCHLPSSLATSPFFQVPDCYHFHLEHLLWPPRFRSVPLLGALCKPQRLRSYFCPSTYTL